MGIETAALIGAAFAAVGTGASIENSNQQRRLAGQTANQQEQENVKLQRAQDDQKLADDATRAAIDQKAKQRQQVLQSQGRSSTLLTSPLGSVGAPVGGAAPMQAKTLLGG